MPFKPRQNTRPEWRSTPPSSTIPMHIPAHAGLHANLPLSTFRPSSRSLRASRTSQNGISTAPQPARLQVTTLMSTSAPLPCTQTPSVSATTSSSCARPGCRMASPTPTTSATTLPSSWRHTRSTSSGSVWSRNTHFSTSTAGRMAGPRTASPLLRARTTAVLVPARSSAETSSRLTTRPACMLASTSPAPTLRSCPLSGSTK